MNERVGMFCVELTLLNVWGINIRVSYLYSYNVMFRHHNRFIVVAVVLLVAVVVVNVY